MPGIATPYFATSVGYEIPNMKNKSGVLCEMLFQGFSNLIDMVSVGLII